MILETDHYIKGTFQIVAVQHAPCIIILKLLMSLILCYHGHWPSFLVLSASICLKNIKCWKKLAVGGLSWLLGHHWWYLHLKQTKVSNSLLWKMKIHAELQSIWTLQYVRYISSVLATNKVVPQLFTWLFIMFCNFVFSFYS